MLILHRYTLRLFLKVLFVSFSSLTGLYIVIDAFNNLDEFLNYGKQLGGVHVVLWDYYAPRVLTFFDWTSGLLVLIAAMFTITWLQRSNEMTALMAAGISQSRIVRPLIVASLLVSGLAAVNRECLIPRYRETLSRSAQNWLGENQRPVYPRYDHRTGVQLSGLHTVAADRKVVQPKFRLPRALSAYGRYLTAGQAFYQAAEADRPAGYLFDGVDQAEVLAGLPSVRVGDQPVLLTAHDTPWLTARQCFLASDIEFEQLAGGQGWRNFASLSQLLAGLRNPSLEYGADIRVAVHVRLVQPLLDATLLLLGLPLVLTREHRNMFVVAGLCLLLVLGFHLVVLTCQTLGAHGYLLSPALAAWCPLLLFVPLTAAFAQPLWDS